MDESSRQLIGEVRKPVGAIPGSPRKYYTGCSREGSAAVSMFLAPLKGWRGADVLMRMAKVYRAYQADILCNEDFPDDNKIILACDIITAHNKSSLYSAFTAQMAGLIARCLERHHAPKRGSRPIMAEIETSNLADTGLKDRI
jgi:hypothetical protein